MLGIACGKTGPSGPPTPEPIIDADLRDMLNLIESNQVAAAAKYEGKLVKISGQIIGIGVARIDLNIRGSDFRVLGDFYLGDVECMLTYEERSKVVKLRKDQAITVTGRVKK